MGRQMSLLAHASFQSPLILAVHRRMEFFYNGQTHVAIVLQCARWMCDVTPHYTDFQLHALIGRDGKRLETKLETPTLIEVWRTAPYLHDGGYLTVHELLSEGRHGLSRSSEELNEEDIHALSN